MKDHEIAEFVNELRDKAVKHKDCQSLREALSKVVREHVKKYAQPAEELQKELVFVGYTNGYQILYGAECEGGEGCFYPDSENDCHIPLYMLKKHEHRLQTTTGMNVTLEQIIKAQKAST